MFDVPATGLAVKIGLVGYPADGADLSAVDARGMHAALARLGHDVFLFAARANGLPMRADSALDAFLADPDHLAILYRGYEQPMRCRTIVRGHPHSGLTVTHERGLHLGYVPSQIEGFTTGDIPDPCRAVLPAFDDFVQLVTLPADSDLLNRWQQRGSVWLTVGPWAAEPAQHLVEAFALCLDRCDEGARLLALCRSAPESAGTKSAGATGIDALHEHAERRNVAAHIELIAVADDAMLKAACLSSDALMVCDDTPESRRATINAMALGTPVVGICTRDLAWIAGNAALLWEHAEPGLLTASVERLRSDASLRSLLRERGFARVAGNFSAGALEARLAALLERFA